MSKNMDIAILLDVYGGMLTEKQSDTLNLYYNEDFSLSEIAENHGITRQGVHKCIRTSEEYLTQLEETLGYAEKYQKLYKIADELEALVNSSVDNGSKEYSKLMKRISKLKDTI